jgi:hypothetical protein
MSKVPVSAKHQSAADIGSDARRALGFSDFVIPPGKHPGSVSIDIPDCGNEDSRRIVSTWLTLQLPGWDQRLELVVA